VFANQLEANQQVATPVDLVLWPENVVNPVPLPTSGWRLEDRLYADDAMTALTAEAARLDAVLVPGWFHRAADDPTANLNYQTAIEPDGTVADRYDKVRTVPFGEFVPMRGLVELLAADMLPSRDLRPGTGPAVLETSIGTMGVTISWEVFFDHRSRDAVRHGGEVILNPTNGASYWMTHVQTQQVASSRLRALENGRWVLQAAPTGFSAVVDPQGRVLQRTAVSEQAVLHHRIERRTGLTWATRAGAWPMAILALALWSGSLVGSRFSTDLASARRSSN
jgi:apolipoprotein N-acyltransferase